MTFTAGLWKTISPIYRAILDHPFNQQLAQGTLPQEQFQFYLKQDALYLVDFAKALALISAKSPSVDLVVDFLHFAEGAIIAERGLHEYYFQVYNTQLDVKYAPGCFNYTNYLLATASLRSYEEAIAAVLPCFWIYREVGSHIYQNSLQSSPSHNSYQKWIDTYAGEEFGIVVDKAIAITDQVAAQTTPRIRDLMQTAFVNSTRLEWIFWDSAYHLEQWQPKINSPIN